MGVITKEYLTEFESKHIGGIWECDEIRNPSSTFTSDTFLFPLCFVSDYFSYFWYGNRDEVSSKVRKSSLILSATPESLRQHNFIKKEAELIAQWDIHGETNRDKLLSIFSFIQHYFRYSQEPASLYEGYLSHCGDCLDQSVMFVEIAHNLSINCYLVVGVYETYPHAWVLAYPESQEEFPIIIDSAREIFDVPKSDYLLTYEPYDLDYFINKAAQQLQGFFLDLT